MPNFLKSSPHLVEVPELDPDLGTAVILSEDDPYESWASVFDVNAEKLDFLLRPGDYRDWGTLGVNNRPGHTVERPRTIRYYNPGVDDGIHPARRGQGARIEAFRFEGSQTQNWLLQGLTLTGPSAEPAIGWGASYITIDRCLIEYPRKYGLRVRGASRSTVQQCVIRHSVNGLDSVRGGDTSGIQIGAFDESVVGLRILDNEIYNVGDGIQLTDNKQAPWTPVEVLVEGNDIYLEPSRYIGDSNMTWDENAIDIKAAADPDKPIIIRNNRMWGHRCNAVPTARGESLVIQRYCRNVVVENNIMGEAVWGVRDFNWIDTPVGGDAHTPRNVVFRNNEFYEIRDYAVGDRGAIARPVTAGILFDGNYFARSNFLVDWTPQSGYLPPTFTNNVLCEMDAVQRGEAASPLIPTAGSNIVIDSTDSGYDTYERRRWTGPEFTIAARPL
jgi:Right handed beta helix region